MNEEPPRILIVDDDLVLRRVVRQVLVRSRYEVCMAGSGEEALELLGQQPVDAVLLDFQLPGMHGIVALEKIRTRFPGVPVVVMTGSGNAEQEVQAAGIEGVGFLLKPFHHTRIVEVVRDVLGSRGGRR